MKWCVASLVLWAYAAHAVRDNEAESFVDAVGQDLSEVVMTDAMQQATGDLTDCAVPFEFDETEDVVPQNLQGADDDDDGPVKPENTDIYSSIFRIKIHVAGLHNATNVKFKIPGGIPLTFDDVTVEEDDDGSYSMFLANSKEDDYSAIFVVGLDDTLTGTVQYQDRAFSIQPLGGGEHALVELDETKFPDEPDHKEAEEGYDERLAGAMAVADSRDVNDNMADSSSEITLIVAYTADAKKASGNIMSLINLAISETNLGLSRSHVGTRVRLVNAYETSYAETGDVFKDLKAFEKKDGKMDEIHSRRDSYKADIAVLIVEKSDYCGVATQILASASRAFAVVVRRCATGYYSFGHEVGHLMGARHDPAQDSSLTPYAYGHGYFVQSKKWRTIMSYNCPGGCTRLNYWSNPSVKYGGLPMGTSSRNDNARVLRNTKYTVANFRQSCQINEHLSTSGTCRTYRTCPNTYGSSYIYLDRHQVECPSKYGLKYLNLRKTSNTVGHSLYYQYTCCKINGATGSNYVGSTPWKSQGGNDYTYLDRHSVSCPSNTVLRLLRLQRSSNLKSIRYYYQCARISKPYTNCMWRSTVGNSMGTSKSSYVYLDRHAPSCPGTYNFMTYMRLYRPSSKTVAMQYRCCTVGYDSLAYANTWSQPEGDGYVYLDRHQPTCYGGHALTKFRLRNLAYDLIDYYYMCKKFYKGNGQVGTYYTSWSVQSGSDYIYLDRQQVKCPTKSVLSSFVLQRSGDKKYIRYKYQCAKTAFSLTCYNQNTKTNYWGSIKSYVYMDRHEPNCGSNYLTRFKLWRPTKSTIAYSYTCCA